MKTVTLKSAGGNISLQSPGVSPGPIRPGDYTVLVIDVPDKIPDSHVLNLYKQSTVFHSTEGSYIVKYEQLGLSKIFFESCDLIGYAEAAEILGWDKRRISTYMQRGNFPEPIQRLASGPIWARQQIEQYRDSRQ